MGTAEHCEDCGGYSGFSCSQLGWFQLYVIILPGGSATRRPAMTLLMKRRSGIIHYIACSLMFSFVFCRVDSSTTAFARGSMD